MLKSFATWAEFVRDFIMLKRCLFVEHYRHDLSDVNLLVICETRRLHCKQMKAEAEADSAQGIGSWESGIRIPNPETGNWRPETTGDQKPENF